MNLSRVKGVKFLEISQPQKPSFDVPIFSGLLVFNGPDFPVKKGEIQPFRQPFLDRVEASFAACDSKPLFHRGDRGAWPPVPKAWAKDKSLTEIAQPFETWKACAKNTSNCIYIFLYNIWTAQGGGGSFQT